jgi:hypothetical protein
VVLLAAAVAVVATEVEAAGSSAGFRVLPALASTRERPSCDFLSTDDMSAAAID